jgi:hypothetical protein
MAYKELPENLVAQVSPLDARNYARATGWQRIHEMPAQIAVYRRPGPETEEITVPQNRNFADYTTRMAEVIATLAEFESRPSVQVLNDILTPQSDILRFRLVDPLTQNGTVPLELGLNLLQGSKKALLASACNVISPQAFYPRLRRSEATSSIDACRLGQTERGSLVATLICPLAAVPGDEVPGQDQTSPRQPPFARRVTTTLTKSLVQMTQLIDQDTPERILHPFEDDIVISANLCEALVEMQPSGERSSLQVTGDSRN